MKVEMNCRNTDTGRTWVVTAAGMVILFLTVGTFRTLGILMVELINVYATSTTEVSLIIAYSGIGFSVTAVLFMFGLGDIFHERALLVFAGLISSVGFMVTYFSRKVQDVYVLGFCTGAAMQIGFSCSLAMVGKYCKKRPTIANGVVVGGVSLATLVLPPFIRWLFDEYTYRGAALIMAGVSLNTVVSGLLMKPKSEPLEKTVSERKQTDSIPPKYSHCLSSDPDCHATEDANKTELTLSFLKSSQESVIGMSKNCASPENNELVENRHKELSFATCMYCVKRFAVKDKINTSTRKNCRRILWFSFTFFKSPSFILYQLFSFFSSTATDALLQFYPAFTTELGMSPYQSVFLLSIVGGADLFGKIIFGLIGDCNIMKRYKWVMVHQYTMACACFLSGFATEFWSQVVFAIVIGFFYGTTFSFRAVMLVDFFGLPTLLRRLGIINIVDGMASIFAGSLLGCIRDKTGNYNLPLQVTGVIFFISGTSLLAIGITRCCQKKFKTKETVQD